MGVINSSGGKLFGGFAIHDVMRGITSPVHTVCVGRCQSMATVLLAAGAEGHRSVLRSARVMIHPTTTSLGGDQRSALMEVEAAEAAQSDKRMIAALSKLSHKPEEEVRPAYMRTTYFDAQAAVDFGLVDVVVEHVTELFPGMSRASAQP